MKMRAALFAVLLGVGVTACDDDSDGAANESETDGHETDGHEDEGDDHGHDHEDEDCDEDEEDCHNHENELITTVTLTFTSEAGDVVTASFEDLDGDGGASGTSETIMLAANTTYSVELELLNTLEDEDVTEEIAEEAEEHFVFIYGDDVQGPASMGSGLLVHAFADVESDYTENAVGEDLPVGIASTITTSESGASELSVLVRHLPDVNGAAQKTADLPDAFLRGETIPGSNDVDVSFDVVVE